MKYYEELANIGRATYVVSFHDGVKTHGDGSPFYDIRIFRNKRAQATFVSGLVAEGYIVRPR
jgi:hypothetical protein